jgi:hypothetical protein
MKKQQLIILLFIMIIGLTIGAYQYVQIFQAELAEAFQASKPANGHAWSEMQCTNGLCVTADDKVGIGTDAPTTKLEVNGSILASGVGDICNSAGKCLSSVYQTSLLTGANPTCTTGQTIIMKGYNGTWYTSDNPSITTWSKATCGVIVTNDSTPFLYMGNHTEGQCVAAGGTVMNAGGGGYCKFGNPPTSPVGSCPSTWTHNGMGTQVATTAWGGYSGQFGGRCCTPAQGIWCANAGNSPELMEGMGTQCTTQSVPWSSQALSKCVASGAWGGFVCTEGLYVYSSYSQVGCY